MTKMTRIYTIDIQERTPNGQRHVVQYTAGEMSEMFTDVQMTVLASGDSVTLGLSQYTDLQAFMDSRA